MTASTSKTELRRSLLTLRQSMSVEQWQTNSQQLCKHLQALPLFIHAQTILAYFSVRQEPDLSSLFHLPKTWGFSRCVETQLVWHQWSPIGSLPLQKGPFGILEPDANAPLLEVEQIDLVLVPAVGCDQRGYRLGYGGGFYDRLFGSPEWTGKPTIGIVFDFAHVSQLPHDPWDQPLGAVCTETGIWKSQKG
ncbi:MAG: 5-formyltetrahydrofolate cyclo-ligase [Leptolyngbyaceae cyanobacterium bins.302]|nr:5-formyltetrahydrofolate cyclo-ligase [Leptolyngbyaceae cyanobacterium bins.302]